MGVCLGYVAIKIVLGSIKVKCELILPRATLERKIQVVLAAERDCVTLYLLCELYGTDLPKSTVGLLVIAGGVPSLLLAQLKGSKTPFGGMLLQCEVSLSASFGHCRIFQLRTDKIAATCGNAWTECTLGGAYALVKWL